MGAIYVVPREPFLGGHFFFSSFQDVQHPPFFLGGGGRGKYFYMSACYFCWQMLCCVLKVR